MKQLNRHLAVRNRQILSLSLLLLLLFLSLFCLLTFLFLPPSRLLFSLCFVLPFGLPRFLLGRADIGVEVAVEVDVEAGVETLVAFRFKLEVSQEVSQSFLYLNYFF